MRLRKGLLQALHQQFVRVVKNDNTPWTGGRRRSGLVASITALPASDPRAGELERVERDRPPTARTTISPNAAASAKVPIPRPGSWRRPIGELARLARAQHDLVAVLQKARAERLRDPARTDDADLHGVLPLKRRAAARPAVQEDRGERARGGKPRRSRAPSCRCVAQLADDASRGEIDGEDEHQAEPEQPAIGMEQARQQRQAEVGGARREPPISACR